MTSLHTARFALWNHPSQHMQGTITWRETPKSKQWKAIVPPTVLPGTLRVLAASHKGIELQLSEAQAGLLREWTSGLPACIMQPTALETGTIVHRGPYTVIGPDMSVKPNHVPKPGATVRARLIANVGTVGTMRKAQLLLVDVLCADVTAS
jgi:hypothetical protein